MKAKVGDWIECFGASLVPKEGWVSIGIGKLLEIDSVIWTLMDTSGWKYTLYSPAYKVIENGHEILRLEIELKNAIEKRWNER